MKNFLLTIIIIGLALFTVHAQDEAIFVDYLISPILVNPAAAGFSENYQIQFNARAQWTGFEDSPKTYAVRYNGPLGRTFGIGIGVFSETAAQLSRTKLHLDYAFRYTVKDDWKLSFGFFTEFQSLKVDGDITSSPFYDLSDQLLEDLLNGKGEFDAAIGIRGTYRKNTFGGVTINNLVTSRLSNIAGINQDENFFSYYTFNFGHRIFLPQQKVTLEPSLMIRQIRNTPLQVDLNLKAEFLNEQLIAGLTYRTLGAMSILLGTKLSNFKLYYSYDVSFQQFQKYSTGAHEITIALDIEKKSKKEREQKQ